MKLSASKECILLLFLSFLPPLLVLAPKPIGAQNQSRSGKEKRDDDLIVCPVHVAFVTVIVRDGEGKEVRDLSKDGFKVYEGGAEKVIDFWHRREVSANGESSMRYEIGYYPADEKLDDSNRRIKVEAASMGRVNTPPPKGGGIRLTD